MSRLADYAVVLMTHLAAGDATPQPAHAAAAATRLPEPTVGKILKALARAGILESQRGSNGGYALARPAAAISIADIIAAVDGPIALTECNDADGGACSLESLCPTRSGWHRINAAVQHALEEISLAEMCQPFAPPPTPARGATARS